MKSRKFLAGFLVFMMLFTMIPTSVFATQSTVADEENVSISVNGNDVELTISDEDNEKYIYLCEGISFDEFAGIDIDEMVSELNSMKSQAIIDLNSYNWEAGFEDYSVAEVIYSSRAFYSNTDETNSEYYGDTEMTFTEPTVVVLLKYAKTPYKMVEGVGGKYDSDFEGENIYIYPLAGIHVVTVGEESGSMPAPIETYSIELDTTNLICAVAELDKETDIATDDEVTLTISPYSTYEFINAPTVSVVGATASAVTGSALEYTCTITDFTSDAVVTVEGEAEDTNAIESPVMIDYIDDSITDEMWDGTTAKTIENDAVITILSDFELKNTLTISADASITGAYCVEVPTNKAAIVVNNGAEVEIDNVEFYRSRAYSGQSENLIIVDGSKLVVTNIVVYEKCRGVFETQNGAEIEVFGENTSVVSKSNVNYGRPVFDNVNGTVSIIDGYFARGIEDTDAGNSGQVIGNGVDSIVNIYGGTIENLGGTTDTVANGKINMTGGTIISSNSAAIRTGKTTDSVNVTGGTIKDSAYGIKVGRNSTTPGGTVEIGGDIQFENNTVDIYLTTNTDYINVTADFEETVTVGYEGSISNNSAIRVTANGTDISLRDNFVAVEDGQSINYNSDSGYLFLWNHEHNWSYTTSTSEPNEIYVSCDNMDCTFFEESMIVKVEAFNGSACTGVYEDVYVTDETVGVIPYTVVGPNFYKLSDDGVTYDAISGIPSGVGDYKVEITLNGCVAYDLFTIEHDYASDCDRFCDVCDFERIALADHDFSLKVKSDDTLYVEANCERGSIYFCTCAGCGEIANDTLNAFIDSDERGHSFTNKVVSEDTFVEDATCQHGDIYFYTCENCPVIATDMTDTFENTDPIPHEFTRMNVNYKYLVSEADCENPSIFWKSCHMCGLASDTIKFGVNNELGHDFSVPQYDENNHWYKCIRCDKIDGLQTHFGGEATCEDKAVCEHPDCNQPYGDLISCIFTKQEVRDDYLKEDATCQHGKIYWKSCTMCDAPSTDEGETFVHTAPVPCNYIMEIQTNDYLIAPATCQNPAVYARACEWCEVPSGDDVDFYEYGTVVPCEFTEENCHPDFLIEEATCGGPAKFVRSCWMCGEADTDLTNYFESGLALDHTFATEYTVEDDVHYYAAVCEHTSERYMEATHVYDQTVTGSAYFVSNATCEHPETYLKSCVCGKAGTETFYVGEVADHTYNELEWVTDDTNHWHATTCVHTDVTKDLGTHISSDWIVDKAAEIGVKGSKHKECTVCAKVLETAEIPARYYSSGVSYYDIDSEKVENGSFTVNRSSAYSGATVKISVKPDTGYEVDKVSVVDSKGNKIDVTKNSDGTYSFKMPSRDVDVDVTFKEIKVVDNATNTDYQNCKNDSSCPMHNYRDIDTNAWYHDGVHYCLDNGFMVGYGNGEFRPTSTTSRAMLITMLWRLEGCPTVNYAMNFNDVSANDWYAEAVRWAQAENIISGYSNGSFGANDTLTREQMVSILWRYAMSIGVDVSVGEDTNILSYNDAFDVSEWAIPAMQWACGAGVVVGDGANLMPTADANRSQMAVIFQRFCIDILKLVD